MVFRCVEIVYLVVWIFVNKIIVESRFFFKYKGFCILFFIGLDYECRFDFKKLRLEMYTVNYLTVSFLYFCVWSKAGRDLGTS